MYERSRVNVKLNLAQLLRLRAVLRTLVNEIETSDASLEFRKIE